MIDETLPQRDKLPESTWLSALESRAPKPHLGLVIIFTAA
jgi:hypothetical protein